MSIQVFILLIILCSLSQAQIINCTLGPMDYVLMSTIDECKRGSGSVPCSGDIECPTDYHCGPTFTPTPEGCINPSICPEGYHSIYENMCGDGFHCGPTRTATSTPANTPTP